jgi:nucleotide-binding universal stress UspA family protein
VAAVTRRLQAKLTLLHIIENLPPGNSPVDRLSTANEAEFEKRKERAIQALAAFQQQHIPQVPSEISVTVGDPARSIVSYWGEDKRRLIVMPTRGFGPFREMLLGSVTAKVLHDAHCAVVTGPHFEVAIQDQNFFKLERIMCAVGLDWETDEILKRSGELARELRAELLAAHVITPVEEGLLPLVHPGSPPISTESVRKAMQDALNRKRVRPRCMSSSEKSHVKWRLRPRISGRIWLSSGRAARRSCRAGWEVMDMRLSAVLLAWCCAFKAHDG